MLPGIGLEQILDRCVRGEIDAILLEAKDIFEPAKEQDFDPDGLGNRAHTRIVTRARKGG